MGFSLQVRTCTYLFALLQNYDSFDFISSLFFFCFLFFPVKYYRRAELFSLYIFLLLLNFFSLTQCFFTFFYSALLFMKQGAVLIEIFPYKYFKESYIKLSATYGIHHRWLQNQIIDVLYRICYN